MRQSTWNVLEVQRRSDETDRARDRLAHVGEKPFSCGCTTGIRTTAGVKVPPAGVRGGGRWTRRASRSRSAILRGRVRYMDHGDRRLLDALRSARRVRAHVFVVVTITAEGIEITRLGAPPHPLTRSRIHRMPS